MANTFKGVTYPTSSDNIAPLETHFANLADKADNVGIYSAKKLFTGPSATGSTVDVAVTFTTAFPSAPKVTATVQGSSGMSVYAVSIAGAPTTTGFTARVFRCNGSTAETDLQLVWNASTYA
jgi:hypothetical protein